MTPFGYPIPLSPQLQMSPYPSYPYYNASYSPGMGPGMPPLGPSYQTGMGPSYQPGMPPLGPSYQPGMGPTGPMGLGMGATGPMGPGMGPSYQPGMGPMYLHNMRHGIGPMGSGMGPSYQPGMGPVGQGMGSGYSQLLTPQQQTQASNVKIQDEQADRYVHYFCNYYYNYL